jgi:hypothetical protein
MMSPFFSKVTAWRKWIFLALVAWAIGLALVAWSTANLRRHQRGALQSQPVSAPADFATRLQGIQQENSRLQSELKTLPELKARAAQLQNEIQANKNATLWPAQSNTLQAAILLKQQEIAEISHWSSEWHKAKQREAAQARLLEKAKETSLDGKQGYAETTSTLSNLALAWKRLSEVRSEWKQLDKSEKDKFRSRLDEAQSQWSAAYRALGKDTVLYQEFPFTNSTDPHSVLLMRSVVPDQNGITASVYLDGTVNFSKAGENN